MPRETIPHPSGQWRDPNTGEAVTPLALVDVFDGGAIPQRLALLEPHGPTGPLVLSVDYGGAFTWLEVPPAGAASLVAALAHALARRIPAPSPSGGADLAKPSIAAAGEVLGNVGVPGPRRGDT